MNRINLSAVLLIVFFAMGTGFGTFVSAEGKEARVIAMVFAVLGLIVIMLIASCCLRPFKWRGSKHLLSGRKTSEG